MVVLSTKGVTAAGRLWASPPPRHPLHSGQAWAAPLVVWAASHGMSDTSTHLVGGVQCVRIHNFELKPRLRCCCLQMVAHELQYLEGMQDTDGGVYCVVKPNTAYGEYYE